MMRNGCKTGRIRKERTKENRKYNKETKRGTKKDYFTEVKGKK